MNLDNFILKGKGVFVFSDPAGANSILAIIDFLISVNKVCSRDFLVFTNSHRPFEAKYSEAIKRVKFSHNFCSKIEKEFQPTYIFSATSLNNYEHLWRTFFFKKIKVYSFIDHWCNYYQRFCFGDELCFGNEVWVIDQIAAKEAIDEGISKTLIRVKGNPYYQKVKAYKLFISRKLFFEKHNLDEGKITILFISDDIRAVFGINEKGECTLGFDEYSVLTDILETLNDLYRNNKLKVSKYQFVIKIHPNAHSYKFNRLIKNYDFIEIKIIKNCDPLDINFYSKYIFGMFSNMVIESFLMKKKLLRVQTGQRNSDIIKLEGIKDKVVNDIDKLYGEMVNFFNLN